MPARVPLTFQQQWLWRLTQNHSSWRCVAAYTFRLRGPLSIPLLRQSFEEVIRRHVSLRARIDVVDGVPQQVVEDILELTLHGEPVAGTPGAEIEASARRCVEEFCDRTVDQITGPFWAAQLLELSVEEHWLVLAMHRLIGDCASIEQTYHEIQALYEALVQGLPSPLKEPARYTDYALTQHRTSLDWLKRHEDYWSQRLAGAQPIQWSSRSDRAVMAAPPLGKMHCFLGEALSTELREFARRARTLAATVMMAVYCAVLSRWSPQTDFVLPVNVAGRQTEHRSVVGYFSYVLFLRIQLTGSETFNEILGHLGNEFFSSLAHQDFGRMAMQHPALLRGTLFQWMTWHPEETSVPPKPSLPKQPVERISVRDFGEGLTIVPPGMTALEITFFDASGGLHAFGSYRADLFTASEMGQFADDLRRATEVFVRNPETRIAEILGRFDRPRETNVRAITAARLS